VRRTEEKRDAVRIDKRHDPWENVLAIVDFGIPDGERIRQFSNGLTQK